MYLTDYTIIWILIGLVVISCGLYLILKSPFCYPYYVYRFDISRKRKPEIMDLIDKFLIDNHFSQIQRHNLYIMQWKDECRKKIENSRFKNYRKRQFYACLDDENAYQFCMTRQQTRYRQRNYVKTSYQVTQEVGKFACNYNFLCTRNNQLREINYECTLREYHSKNQRKLMTKEIRRKIMIRDKYTCQYCGKYMPDEVGLHIDHIIPVSKGGKTIPSNLQVLCSKCNGNKSNKS
ncbi:HNH endonuclease [Mediterraneibacter glycyrrhizinilyticus]|uniref:HNH endonuclease n=1 Tax=Mediterraneibacter glycyrrhizinilyticus TaxID=342942 RepID=UPI00189CA668|nr:HNH endonuclease [Mediterraneibacter glycyrrhizinilyticus]